MSAADYRALVAGQSRKRRHKRPQDRTMTERRTGGKAPHVTTCAACPKCGEMVMGVGGTFDEANAEFKRKVEECQAK